MKYREDIDYLRAIAVLSVVFFHFGVPGFSGGFVGVDIFFVISGYLITGLINSEIEAGIFSFAKFYERRVRRILPALYVMMAVVAIVAWFLLLPFDYLEFFRSAVSVILFASNLFFWQQVGYFDASPVNKILLHTWSLSVEEQFYLVFPTLSWLFFRARYWAIFRHPMTPISIVAFGIVGLCALSQIAVVSHPASAFYLAPYRAWEFLLGTLLVWTKPWAPVRPTVRSTMLAAGLVMMAFAIIGFSSSTQFPGVSALVPCVGATLYLYSNECGERKSKSFELWAIPAFFGKISYSLYLWHWPIFAFVSHLYNPNDLTGLEVFLMVGAAVSISSASYFLIEQPIRRRQLLTSRKSLFAGMSLVSVILLGASFFGVAESGFPNRYDFDGNLANITKFNGVSIKPFYREGTCFLDVDQTFSEYDKTHCLKFETGKKNILLVGDSVAAHYFYGLNAVFGGGSDNFMQLTAAGCAPYFDANQATSKGCDDMNEFLRNELKTNPPGALIISANWRAYATERAVFETALPLLLEEISKDQVPTILFGPSAEFTEPLPSIIARSALARSLVDQKKYLRQDAFDLDVYMEQLARRYKYVTYVSVLKGLCPNYTCPLEASHGIPLLWDIIHLTPDGSILAIRSTSSQFAWRLQRIR